MKYLLCLVIFSLVSCSTGPDAVVSSSWNIKRVGDPSAVKNVLSGECKIYNSSSSTVYTDYKAVMVLSGNKEKSLKITVPVAIERIMPYNYGTFPVRFELNDKELGLILSETSSDKVKYEKDGVIEDIFFNRENIKLEKIVFKKKDINTILEGK